MAITPIQNLISAVLSGSQPVVSPTATDGDAAGLVQAAGSSTLASTSSTPVASLATADLQNASVGLAQLSSLLEEAQSGTQQIGNILQQLENLAGQAQSGGPPSALASLDSEFQQLLSQINQVVEGTTFDGANLLNGSLSAQTDSNTPVSIPDLSTAGLFGSTPPNLLSAGNASEALAAVTNAENVVGGASGAIAATQDEVSLAAANVDTALANDDAAGAVLSDSDLAAGATGDMLAGLMSNLGTTASAQTDNMPATLLSLLQE